MSPQQGWLAGDGGGLRQTVDGGEHWREVPTGVGVSLLGLHFVHPQRGWIAGDFGVILGDDGNRLPAGKPGIFSVVNAASYAPHIASGAWIAISGANLAPATRNWQETDFAGNKLPVSLHGVRANINGRPAYPYYISPTQINALAPAGCGSQK